MLVLCPEIEVVLILPGFDEKLVVGTTAMVVGNPESELEVIDTAEGSNDAGNSNGEADTVAV